jgi:hypothetical protein
MQQYMKMPGGAGARAGIKAVEQSWRLAVLLRALILSARSGPDQCQADCRRRDARLALPVSTRAEIPSSASRNGVMSGGQAVPGNLNRCFRQEQFRPIARHPLFRIFPFHTDDSVRVLRSSLIAARSLVGRFELSRSDRADP